MVRPRRNHDRIFAAYPMFFLLVKDEFGLALLDAKELVDIRVHPVTNLFARPQAHHDKLRVLTGE